MSQKQKLCDFCGKPIKWPDNYQKGMKPVNLDGSVHDCRNNSTEVVPPSDTPKTSDDLPISTEKPIQIQASKGVKIIITIEVIPDA